MHEYDIPARSRKRKAWMGSLDSLRSSALFTMYGLFFFNSLVTVEADR